MKISRKEVVEAENRKLVNDGFAGGVKGCPHQYGFRNDCKEHRDCWDCWNKEAERPAKKKGE